MRDKSVQGPVARRGLQLVLRTTVRVGERASVDSRCGVHFVFLCVHVHLWVRERAAWLGERAREHSWAGGARSILCRIGRDVSAVKK